MPSLIYQAIGIDSLLQDMAGMIAVHGYVRQSLSFTVEPDIVLSGFA